MRCLWTVCPCKISSKYRQVPLKSRHIFSCVVSFRKTHLRRNKDNLTIGAKKLTNKEWKKSDKKRQKDNQTIISKSQINVVVVYSQNSGVQPLFLQSKFHNLTNTCLVFGSIRQLQLCIKRRRYKILNLLQILFTYKIEHFLCKAELSSFRPKWKKVTLLSEWLTERVKDKHYH